MTGTVVASGRGGEGAGAAEPLVLLSGVSKRYGAVVACDAVDLRIERGDFLALLGPSGSGKTTLLRIIGGFAYPDVGRVVIDGVDVTRMPPEDRPTNMVFQGYSLFPHMTVRQNIQYGLKVKRIPPAEAAARTAEIIALTRLEGLEDRAIGHLSGGQQQRVALARALVLRPKVLLLDEPLSALDLKLRQSMQEELRRIHRLIGGTFVFVTHDQNEALWLANRIAVLANGRIVQQGSGEDVYGAPASRFVSAFIGEANTLAGRRRHSIVELEAGPSFPAAGPDEPVTAMIRPHLLRIAETAGPGEVLLGGRLRDVVFLGPRVRYQIELANGTELAVDAVADRRRQAVVPGAMLSIAVAIEDLLVLARDDPAN